MIVEQPFPPRFVLQIWIEVATDRDASEQLAVVPELPTHTLAPSELYLEEIVVGSAVGQHA